LVNQHGGKIVYRLIIAGIGVLAVALLAIGCGGGGSDEATAQVSKAQFFKQARAICAKTQENIEAELRSASQNASSKNFSALYKKVGQLRENEAEELDAISGSKKVEEKVGPLITKVLRIGHLLAREGQAAATDPSIEKYRQEAIALHLIKC
jgi:hypothetical protein